MKRIANLPEKKSVLITAAAFVLLLLIYIGGLNLVRHSLEQSVRQTITQEIYLYGTSVSNSVNQKLALLYGLTAYTAEEVEGSGELSLDDFNAYSYYIYSTTSSVKNIAVAPQGVMEYVYPYEENKNVIGYNPALDERFTVREEVRRAIETKQIVLSQPYELIQGGLGLIARQAIYVNDEYWGLTNLVIDLPAMFEETGIQNPSYEMAIAILDQQDTLFYGDGTVLENDPVAYSISLPEGAWTLLGAPANGWRAAYAQQYLIFQLLAALLLIAGTAVVYLIVSRNVRLYQLVEVRTSELKATEDKLRKDIAVRERIKKENEKLLAQESQQRNLAETLSEVTLLFTSHTSIDQLLDEILTQIHRLVPYETANIVLLEGKMMITKAQLGYQKKELIDFLYRFDQNLDEYYFDALAIKTRKPVVVKDVQNEDGWVNLEETKWIQSYMSIPISYRDEVLGLIRLDGKLKNMFSHEDAEKLQPLANAAAIALNNARLYEQAQREIEERKKAEEQVHQLNDELEQRVEERTEQLQHMNEEMEAFAYSISHDLRAPVRAIMGIAQLFYEEYGEGINAEGQEYLERIAASGKRMNELIEGLLTLSYLGKQELNLQTFNLSNMSSMIFSEIVGGEADRQCELVIPERLEITGDRNLIEALLTNLISNAVKFTRSCEQAVIEIGAETRRGHPVVFVRDNGIGFNMDYADKLFEPFNRLDHDNTIEGTGIGLTIVKRVVERHGGDIWVESRLGEGSTFFFYLSELEPEED